MRKRHLSQRNYRLVEQIRQANEELRQRDRGMAMRYRTLTLEGVLVAVGPAIEAVPVGEGSWAA